MNTDDVDRRFRDAERAPRGVDTSKAHPSRRYDYWLGGKDNFAIDRESAEAVAAGFPTVRLAAVENRKFLRRVVNHLVRDVGVDQFLDIGTGLPSAGNVHEVAQSADPRARIVYVDNDPIVLTHARALLTSSPEGATAYLDADLRDPEKILTHPDLHRTLDLSRPVALMMVAVLHFITEDEDPYGVVRTLVGALPSGSHIVITHGTSDHLTPEELAETEEANRRSGVPFRLRSSEEFARFFTGLDVLDPGITSVVDWRPDEPAGRRPAVEDVSMLCALARVP
ncbi:SAM-dependent methyltransferase [Actinoallomurus rhizosphaericola]|uniref:SAM-dependent methyltransferase n=1 Tax=Actinoallomurus rhizosphaericola TaxID=2952536 RepID=UPI002092E34E|nr:SAM-dependent methyltransferase [Actinoallomurus rhizosphaericola]MCO5997252.1 SAM-dependent methyltransferase [Actinoallomurus rhizosphaericola]